MDVRALDEQQQQLYCMDKAANKSQAPAQSTVSYTALTIESDSLSDWQRTGELAPYKVQTFSKHLLLDCHRKLTHNTVFRGSSSGILSHPRVDSCAAARVQLRVALPKKLTATQMKYVCVVRVLRVDNFESLDVELLVPDSPPVRLKAICRQLYRYKGQLQQWAGDLQYVVYRRIIEMYEDSTEETRSKVVDFICKPKPPDALGTIHKAPNIDKSSFRYAINQLSWNRDLAPLDLVELVRACGAPEQFAGFVFEVDLESAECLATKVACNKAVRTFAREDAEADPSSIGLTAQELKEALRTGKYITGNSTPSKVVVNGKEYMQLIRMEETAIPVKEIREALASEEGFELMDSK